MQFDWSAIWPAIPLLIEGAKMTLWISVLGLAGGLVIGLLAGFARTFGGWIANHVALVFIEVIRGTPIVVQVMFIYFALPMAFNDLRIDPFTAAVDTIMINTGAYMSEIVRGGIISVDRGQTEGAMSVGMTHWQTMVGVIFPQAVRNIMPAIGNEFVVNIKDSSVLNVIAVAELFFNAKSAAGTYLRYFEVFTIVGLIYFVLTFTVTRLLRVVEKHMDGPDHYVILGSQIDVAPLEKKTHA